MAPNLNLDFLFQPPAEKHKAEKRRSSSEDDDPDGDFGEGKKKMDIDRK